MNKTALKKILDHPDKDEIIAKLVIGQSPKDIYDWLKVKYTNVSEAKFVVAEKSLKSFQDNYLDIYNLIHEDLSKTKTAMATGTEDQLELAVKNNAAYKNIMIETASKQLDVRTTVAQLCVAVETRLAQVFDEIQEDPRNINTKVDRLLIEYAEVLGNILEKYYKFTENPADQIIQHNVTLQVVDQHISVFHDVIKEVLAQMDLETSMYFMEVFNEKMSKLKAPDKEAAPNVDMQLADARLLSETINKKVNGE
jgi:hypothetical protein